MLLSSDGWYEVLKAALMDISEELVLHLGPKEKKVTQTSKEQVFSTHTLAGLPILHEMFSLSSGP